jgi:glucose-6-phosphate dehydrogenase assembly protein OpcA
MITSSQIEKELLNFWIDSENKVSPKKSFQRIYTTNVVVYTSKHLFGHYAENSLGELSTRHPGRYILIRPANDLNTDPVRFFISGHFQIGDKNEKRNCCEIIKLVSHSPILNQMYSFASSLLMPDLPLEFWWIGQIPQNDLFFSKMSSIADRIWVDSQIFENPLWDLKNFELSSRKYNKDILLGDLNWIRIYRWREIIAELFDGAWSRYLLRIKNITIKFGEGFSSFRGLLMACWMAVNLKWNYIGKGIQTFPEKLEFQSLNREPITVYFQKVKDSDAMNRLYSVEIETSEPEKAIFQVKREKDPQCVLSQSIVNGEIIFSRTTYFEHLHSSQLLLEGLKRFEPDRVFEKVLQLIRTMVELHE